MEWTQNRSYPSVDSQDVYADVKTSFSANDYSNTAVEEYDLEAIQEKLGQFAPQISEEVAVSTPDTLPSSQTLKMNYERQYEAQAKTATKLNTRTKVMIASYALVVLALIIAVTLCGVSVTGSFGAAAALNAESATLATQVAELTEQAETEDYASLIEQATALGYIDSSTSNTLTYSEIETRPAQNFDVQTNWFDSLCDWFSNAFGG